MRLATLGAYPVTDTTEARYAEIGREMAAGGDWIVPRVDLGRPFWAKPPLSTWATAASFRVFGVNEFAARLPSFVMVALTGWLVWLLARRLHGRGIAAASVAVLVTGALGFGLAGGVMTDPALGLATTMTVVGFVLAVEDRDRPSRGRAWAYLAFAGVGLGLLAKGPIATILSCLPIAVSMWTRRGRGLHRHLPWVTGPLLALAIAVPWYAAAEARTPGFLEYFLVGEHFKRFTDPHWSGDLYGAPRTKPRGTIWVLGLGAALPWTLLVGAALVAERQRLREMAARTWREPWGPLFAVWALAPLAFFTLAGSVLFTYVWPGMPAFAVLAARLLARGEPDGLPRARRGFLVAAAIVPAGFLVAVPLVREHLAMRDCQLGVLRRFDVESRRGAVLAYAMDDVPSSADFYSQGTARRMGGADDAAWAALLADHEDVFVVTRPGARHGPPAAVHARLRPIEDFDRYRLWRCVPAGESPRR